MSATKWASRGAGSICYDYTRCRGPSAQPPLALVAAEATFNPHSCWCHDPLQEPNISSTVKSRAIGASQMEPTKYPLLFHLEQSRRCLFPVTVRFGRNPEGRRTSKANINRSFEVAAGAHSFETALQRTQNWRNSLQVAAIVAAGNQYPKRFLTIGECEMGSGAQAAQVGPGFST